MLGVLIMGMIIGCGGDETNGTTGNTNLKWPDELTPNNTGGSKYEGEFRKNKSEMTPVITFSKPSTLFYGPNDGTYNNVKFELISINGKKYEIEVTGNGTSLSSFTIGSKYILCDNYTLASGTLTLTGGNLFSSGDLIWNLYP